MADRVSEELVYVATDDNIQLAGQVISPAEEDARHMSVVWIHGNAASFYDWPYVVIGRELAQLGFPVILANTRGHDIATTLWRADDHSPMAGGGGSGWERMEDAPRDVVAWVDFAATREPSGVLGGVLLAGHSKGAQKVILYAAQRPHERLGGVALISPDLHGLRIPGELEAARALVAEGRGMEMVPAQPWAPWYRQSAQTVVSHAETADGLPALLASVVVPVLATFGGRERSGEPDLAAIREQATGAPSVASEIIADGDHFYAGREVALAKVIAQWSSALSM